MRVWVSGGTGFIGRHLVASLLERGDECIVLSRSGRGPWRHPRVRVVVGDPTEPGEWQEAVAAADAVVNLAGAPIVDPTHRWTDARKRVLTRSRVESTTQVVAAIAQARSRPRVLVNASAIGYYGDRGDEVLDESAAPGADFLADLGVAWETAAREAEPYTRVVRLRTGLVLGDGGVLGRLLPLFRLGLGGAWGSGRQWFSWIHLVDEVGLIRHAIDQEIHGALNLTAPHPCTVGEFARTLAAVLNRPAFLHAPAFALRLGLGEAATALLMSQRVVPRRALEDGFAFRYPELRPALADLFG